MGGGISSGLPQLIVAMIALAFLRQALIESWGLQWGFVAVHGSPKPKTLNPKPYKP